MSDRPEYECGSDDICSVYLPDEGNVQSLKGSLPDLEQLSHLFGVLSEQTRVRIIYLLWQRELCVCDLAEILQSSVSNISHHLRVLRSARLVKYRRDGRKSIYSLDDEHIMQLLSAAMQHAHHIDQQTTN